MVNGSIPVLPRSLLALSSHGTLLCCAFCCSLPRWLQAKLANLHLDFSDRFQTVMVTCPPSPCVTPRSALSLSPSPSLPLPLSLSLSLSLALCHPPSPSPLSYHVSSVSHVLRVVHMPVSRQTRRARRATSPSRAQATSRYVSCLTGGVVPLTSVVCAVVMEEEVVCPARERATTTASLATGLLHQREGGRGAGHDRPDKLHGPADLRH